MNVTKIMQLQTREARLERAFTEEELGNYYTAKSFNEALRNIRLELRRLGA